MINEGVMSVAMLDTGIGHQLINACLSIAKHDEGHDTMDIGHGFGDMIYKILLRLQSDTGSLLELHTRMGHRTTYITRAMGEIYEDLCNTDGTIFPTTMPEDAHDIAIGLGQSVHHCEENDQTYRDGALLM